MAEYPGRMMCRVEFFPILSACYIHVHINITSVSAFWALYAKTPDKQTVPTPIDAKPVIENSRSHAKTQQKVRQCNLVHNSVKLLEKLHMLAGTLSAL
jgi:hypothetical protein